MSTMMADNKSAPTGGRANLKVKPTGREEANKTLRQPALSSQDDRQSSTSPATTCSASNNHNASIKSQAANSSATTTTTTTSQAGHKQDNPDIAGNHRLDTAKCPTQPGNTARKASTTAGKFKEKRPEPLKLNQNPNQEIPLDLSVKSAGNAPSGGMFLLTNTNHLNTLETPRIQWEDNDILQASSKGRLFSSSTNASQQARLPSLIGDSPPITPGTSSFLDPTIPTSPMSATTLRSLYTTSHSMNFGVDSPLGTLIASPFELNKFQLLRYYQVRNDARGKPRRSCSSDNLDHMTNNNNNNKTSHGHLLAATLTPKPNDTDLKGRLNKVKTNRQTDDSKTTNDSIQQSKKNSISPLATKSLSSSTNDRNSSNVLSTNFPYLNSSNHQLSPNNSCEHQLNSSPNSLSPTNVANATANLFNIHLNSPTRSGSDLSPTSVFDTSNINHQQQPYHPSSLSSLSDFLVASQKSQPDSNLIDPLFSATATAAAAAVAATSSSHQSLDLRSSTSSNSTSSVFGHTNVAEPNNEHQRYNNLLHSSYLHHQQQINQTNHHLHYHNHHHHHNNNSNHHHHQALSSLGGSTTLNTPTMISPSQLKTGNLCFLPSPTLSPMQSVFELPSPLLMFSHNNSNAHQQQHQNHHHHQQQTNSGANGNRNAGQANNNNETSNNSSHHHRPMLSSPASSSSNSSELDANFTATSAITSADSTPAPADDDKVKPDQAASAAATATSAQLAGSSDGDPCQAPTKSSDGQLAVGGPPSARALSDNTLSSNAKSIASNQPVVLSASDLSHLITPATRKVKSMKMATDEHDVCCANDGDVQMDVVNDENDQHTRKVGVSSDLNNNEAPTVSVVQELRPATVIPQIYVTQSSKMSHTQPSVQVSTCIDQTNWPGNNQKCVQQSRSLCPLLVTSSHDDNQQDQQRSQRDLLGKRSLSPKSFRARVNLYHNERLESCSAPPDVYQRRARAKIKTATSGDAELAGENDLEQLARDGQHYNSAQNIHSINQHHSLTAAPYPVGLRLTPGSQQHPSALPAGGGGGGGSNNSLQTATNTCPGRGCLSGRSSSAEPQGSINHPLRGSSFHPHGSVNSSGHYNNTGGGAGPLAHTYGFSHSVQHLQGNAQADVMRASSGTGGGGVGVQVGQFLSATRQQQQSHGQTGGPQQPPPAPLAQAYQGQHSISTGELHRFPDVRLHGQSTRAEHFQQPNEHQFEHYQAHNHQYNFGQPFQQQGLRSSLSGLDNLLNHNHHQQQQQQQQQQQHYQHQGLHNNQHHQIGANVHMRRFEQEARHQQQHSSSGALDVGRLPSGNTRAPLADNQPFAVNLFTGNHCARAPIEGALSVQSIVERGRPVSGATQPGPTTRPTSSATTTTPPPPLSTAESKLFGTNTNTHNDCLYAIDIEARPESASNNSLLEFCSLTGSRSSSANSSNVAAKKYHCDQCSKSFTRSDMLTRHKRLHSGDRPFQCNECKQEFSRSDHLSTHMRTHTGEKPYKCKLCSYSACRKDMITRHMKVHNRSPDSLHPMESN